MFAVQELYCILRWTAHKLTGDLQGCKCMKEVNNDPFADASKKFVKHNFSFGLSFGLCHWSSSTYNQTKAL